MEAALGVAQLEEQEGMILRRRAIAARLTAGLSNLRAFLQLPDPRPRSEHVYMFYPLVLIDSSYKRDELVLFLEERGVETRYLLPLINQPIYRNLFGDLDAEFPVSARLNQTAFYIGSHPGMSDADVDYIIEKFQQFFGVKK